MNEQDQINYQRVAEAIAYIQTNFKHQPGLDEVASHVHLSAFHFQRLFTEWAGVSPKKFLQYLSVGHAKQILQQPESTLFSAAHDTGLSGTGRLHDLFVNIEGMTPGEYKNGGENLSINYSYTWSRFGGLLMASTPKGICYMGFVENKAKTFEVLTNKFPHAKFTEQLDEIQENALRVYNSDWDHIDQIKLHLKGTNFQLKVWEALLKVPSGQLSTYGKIAEQIKSPKASRAVGTAIGSNPVAFLIPCHRVIQSSGALGGYRWGETRKSAIIGWESAQLEMAQAV
ncbi:MAG: methylated-DNA--[protein]-cysteine S-methyltransferase [Reichenbachiella sp.]|uniref:methylated-DNA--[protein]-cysteine S-methyltransferase n=1 Tax=Reichenbachiella sp. TaxID=2184521 RepID=UPI00326666E4